MSKVTVALGSFVIGACFALFVGRYTSTIVQPVFAQVTVRGAEPIIPPLIDVKNKGGKVSDEAQQLDGLDCEDCSYNNVKFVYSGGAVNLVNPHLSGKTSLELRGAAANGQVMAAYLAALAGGKPPRPVMPNAPVLKTTTLSTPMTVSFKTPFGPSPK